MTKISGIIIDKIKELQPYIDFTETTDLLEEEIMDSLMVLTLVMDLEEYFEIEISPEEITKENFTSVNTIVNFISLKCEGNEWGN